MRTFRRADDDIIMFVFARRLCEHSFYFPMSISDQSQVVTLEGCKSWSIIKLSSGSSWGARPKHLSLVSSQPSLPRWTRLIFNGIQWTKFWSLEIHLKWGGGEQHDAFWYLALFFLNFGQKALNYLSKESGRDRLLLLLPALSQGSSFCLDLKKIKIKKWNK